MADQGYFLTQAERDLLQQTVDVVRRLRPELMRPGKPETRPAPEAYVARPHTAAGIPARSGAEPGKAACDVYFINDGGAVPALTAVDGVSRDVYNLSTSALPQEYLLVHRDKYGRWIASVGGGGDVLVECCLAEDHPGRGVVFDVWVGSWDPGADGWDYSPGTGTGTAGGTLAKAIDWRYATPYPGAGSKGLFTPRASTVHGTIYECVSFDCDVPPEGCAATSGSGS